MNAGIYIIENKIAKRAYIGQSVNVETRLAQHFNALRNHNHQSGKMQSDFDAGAKLEDLYCQHLDGAEWAMTICEQLWIDFMRAVGYEMYNTIEPCDPDKAQAFSPIVSGDNPKTMAARLRGNPFIWACGSVDYRHLFARANSHAFANEPDYCTGFYCGA